MSSINGILTRSFAAGALGFSLCAGAVMAEYPERPISVVVSYGAGGATDFQARIVTMMAAKEDKEGKPVYLNGQPIVIVNRPGAGGQVGWNSSHSAADPGFPAGECADSHFFCFNRSRHSLGHYQYGGGGDSGHGRHLPRCPEDSETLQQPH